ncbi:MAG: hypothetical protein V1736_00780 [Pseudomonadota bacterium]
MDRVKKYTHVFATMGLLFGALALLPFCLKLGIWQGIRVTAVLTIAWTATAGPVLVLIDYFTTRNLPPDAIDVSQTREIQVVGDVDQVFQKCLNTLRALRSIKNVKPAGRRLFGRTKPSFSSFGEEITVSFEALDSKSTRIQIISAPVVKITLLDYGKNYKNTVNIMDAIQKVMQADELA